MKLYCLECDRNGKRHETGSSDVAGIFASENMQAFLDMVDHYRSDHADVDLEAIDDVDIVTIHPERLVTR